MPGPPVAVCKGDQVIVEINNKLHTEVTTMHFHGKFKNLIFSFTEFLSKK